MKLQNDFLYIGDSLDNTVKTFDAETGRFLGSFVASGNHGLSGPRGLIFGYEGNLLVTNQNVGQTQSGDVLKYNEQIGAFAGELVKSNEADAPLAPRGIVLSKQKILFVADMGDFLVETGVDIPGEVRMYNGITGMFLGNLNHFGLTRQFHPRGMVIGPDGNLYITSFRKDTSDTDKILIFDGVTGKFLEKIDLDTVGQPRAFAQALLFGPDGKLFVPITGDGPDTGSVRRYNLYHRHKSFDVFVPPASMSGPLGLPWYLTFGNTDSATLNYE